MPFSPIVHSSPVATGAKFQVESVSGRLVIATLGDKLTPAGVAAVLAQLDTYYTTTITPAQRVALAKNTGDTYVTVNAGKIFAAVAPGTEAALANNLVTALQVAGNTVAG
jgi:hypothetical protein